MDCADLFKNKRITLLGLGLLGRGVGDAEFLAQCGAQVTVTDKKTEAELAASVEKLKQYSNVTFHLGGHDSRDFTDTDLVIKAAGVRLDSTEIAAARAAGVPVMMSTALFAKYAMEAGAKIVGITGTRGKTTVAHMIHDSLISAFAKASADRRAFLGGNVRGISTLAMLPDVKAGDVVVLELDSWQLQGFGDLKISPNVAVFTNLMPDHMNYYDTDMEKYFVDKANIFKYQKTGDMLVVGDRVADRVRAAHPPVAPAASQPIPEEWALEIPGEHNRENAALAAATLTALGLSQEDVREGLESFEGVDGRLQFVRELHGVKIYNDNNATTPEATIAALRALGKDITLIVGGSEKGLALEELISEIKKAVSHITLLVHQNYQGSERLKKDLDAEGISYTEARDLQGAVDDAVKSARSGTILFSPAFASFGMFKNEYERNDQFLEIVRKMGGVA
ncbi:hypothetical protein A3C18_02230 [Candidatus Kaiserbacteria bacterium RIFCSPHIGHO2_02_FULL_54_11b]|uniref:UDP-N-acetylmuramoylalanine--D-glutamate ligase n=1 Tax=Candidatus Kaiserbacteria bacterium RIFCSPHIGHO2_02_FULL_54_11b TaxID=1798494 RepID=A0A1F6DS29_9BACT|nr:MAG: hypothetical protein A3C18_02230 [Candidatus Kaiserbacteria bacterium RIFCSPHIGHO2_02_FULL_54_11b]